MSILEINLFVLFRQSKQVTVAEKQVAEFLEVLAHLARSIKGKKLLAESRSNGANVLARSVKMSRNSEQKKLLVKSECQNEIFGTYRAPSIVDILHHEF